MESRFAWNEWNLEHVAKHGVTRQEAEYVVSNAETPFPWPLDDERMVVLGWTGTRYIQIIFILTTPERDIYIIHARPLDKKDWQQFEG